MSVSVSLTISITANSIVFNSNSGIAVSTTADSYCIITGAGSSFGGIRCFINTRNRSVSITAINIPVNSGLVTDSYYIIVGVGCCSYSSSTAAGSVSITAVNIVVNSGLVADSYIIFVGVGCCSYSSPAAAGNVSGTAINTPANSDLVTDAYCIFVGISLCIYFNTIAAGRGSLSVTGINTITNSSFSADGYFIFVGISRCICIAPIATGSFSVTGINANFGIGFLTDYYSVSDIDKEKYYLTTTINNLNYKLYLYNSDGSFYNGFGSF